MNTVVSINEEQQLFVIPCSSGYTCLGFDVCFEWSCALATELGVTVPMKRLKNTIGAYEYYRQLLDIARERHNKTGWRSTTQLTPQLNGLEGKRVEVIDKWGEKRRFIVGKSTGFVPCHLEIKTKQSFEGCTVMGAPFRVVNVVNR